MGEILTLPERTIFVFYSTLCNFALSMVGFDPSRKFVARDSASFSWWREIRHAVQPISSPTVTSSRPAHNVPNEKQSSLRSFVKKYLPERRASLGVFGAALLRFGTLVVDLLFSRSTTRCMADRRFAHQSFQQHQHRFRVGIRWSDSSHYQPALSREVRRGPSGNLVACSLRGRWLRHGTRGCCRGNRWVCGA